MNYMDLIWAKGSYKMFIKKDEYIKPEVMIIKFGSEDIITTSPGDDDTDPGKEDIFD